MCGAFCSSNIHVHRRVPSGKSCELVHFGTDFVCEQIAKCTVKFTRAARKQLYLSMNDDAEEAYKLSEKHARMLAAPRLAFCHQLRPPPLTRTFGEMERDNRHCELCKARKYTRLRMLIANYNDVIVQSHTYKDVIFITEFVREHTFDVATTPSFMAEGGTLMNSHVVQAKHMCHKCIARMIPKC